MNDSIFISQLVWFLIIGGKGGITNCFWGETFKLINGGGCGRLSGRFFFKIDKNKRGLNYAQAYVDNHYCGAGFK